MEPIIVNVKALSVNKAYKGRRFKTNDYKEYEQEVLALLPDNIKIPKNRKLELKMEICFSNKLSDLDNPVKLFTDTLQKKYSFNDRWIYKIELEKKIVKKGKEKITFTIGEV